MRSFSYAIILIFLWHFMIVQVFWKLLKKNWLQEGLYNFNLLNFLFQKRLVLLIFIWVFYPIYILFPLCDLVSSASHSRLSLSSSRWLTLQTERWPHHCARAPTMRAQSAHWLKKHSQHLQIKYAFPPGSYKKKRPQMFKSSRTVWGVN